MLFFEKMEIYLKANLLKGRDAKPEGAKVRKFDQVSRLLLFHIIYGKAVKTEEISMTFIRYRCVIFNKSRKSHASIAKSNKQWGLNSRFLLFLRNKKQTI